MAATAMALGMALATGNAKPFGRVGALKPLTGGSGPFRLLSQRDRYFEGIDQGDKHARI
jgi:hypothetical protein